MRAHYGEYWKNKVFAKEPCLCVKYGKEREGGQPEKHQDGLKPLVSAW